VQPEGDPVNARVSAYLRDLEADPAAVHAAIHALTPPELAAYGARAYHLNLLSLYGAEWAPERVERAAGDAMRGKLWRGWQFYSGWRRLSRVLEREGEGAAPRLAAMEGWPRALETIRGAGTPVVVCTLHLGAYRDIPLELALLGKRIMLPVNTSGFEQTSDALSHSHPLVSGRWRLANVDRPGGAVALARAARQGDLLFAYVDGNTGTDGPWGTQGRTTVSFLGFEVRVKDGMARLAAALGAPVVPLVSPRLGADRAEVRVGEPIDPGGRLKGEAQDRFAHQATQALYTFFEPNVRAAPHEWESLCFLHRWRERPEAPPASAAPAAEPARGYRLDQRRVALVDSAAGPVLMNVQSLRSFRVPDWARGAVAELTREGGLREPWLADAEPASRARTLEFVAQLQAHGVVVPV
jgi:lauroyl/myristoyl acyltransferase